MHTVYHIIFFCKCLTTTTTIQSYEKQIRKLSKNKYSSKLQAKKLRKLLTYKGCQYAKGPKLKGPFLLCYQDRNLTLVPLDSFGHLKIS